VDGGEGEGRRGRRIERGREGGRTILHVVVDAISYEMALQYVRQGQMYDR